MKKRIISIACIILTLLTVLPLASCFKQKPLEKKYDYDMSKYITIPDFQNYVVDVELDALQAAIDSYLVQSATEYVVSRGDDIYVDITVYEEMILESSNGDVIKKKGNKIDALSKPNYLIENLGSSPLPYKLETDIINAELNLKDVITRKYAVGDLEDYVTTDYAGENLYFEVKIMNKVTEPGDVLTVKYEAYLVDEDDSIILDKDGKETPFDKGDSSTFFLGSKLAINDFENGLTGILLYEEHSFYATFPDDYIDEDYQNKKALFKVTANGLYTAPIYNNDFIKKVFPDYITTTEFEGHLKKEYIKEKMFDYLFDNVTIKDYPEAEYNEIKKDIEESAPSFKEYYGITFDEYIKGQGFNSRDEYIKSNMKTEMIYYTISKNLGIKPTDAQLENERQNLINYYKALYMEQQKLDEKTALSTAEEFVKNLGDIYIYENVMYALVEIELYDNAKSNELERTYESISEVLAKEAAGKTE
ncbi:MAG: hypothetical protein J6A90_08830 [Clostridia bacterium]|nr:hypothetical protein [Clostridia bacterium]